MLSEMKNLSIYGAKVWVGDSEPPKEKILHVSDGIFTENPTDDAIEVNASGLVIIPGLIEAHAHLCLNAGEDWEEVQNNDSSTSMSLRMIENAQKMLRAGITTIRDLGAPTELAVSLRNSINEGIVTGPELFVAGAPITTTAGHGNFWNGEADGELGVRIAVRERIKAGVDWIKVMASGGNMTPGSNTARAQYSIDEMKAIVEESHRLGTSVTAHAHGAEGIRHALAGGVDMIEHCTFQTESGSEPIPEVISDIISSQTIVSPTLTGSLALQKGTELYEKRSELTRQLVDGGAKIVMSTDCGIPGTPHEYLSHALETMRDMSGLSAIETLRLATSTSAHLLSLKDRGKIKVGFRADLIALNGDPTNNLAALREINFVMSGGSFVHL
tara:strand:+ start:15305 stop:16462 length:1158 start_codon:yes stop_codon:yes gene_type:complete